MSSFIFMKHLIHYNVLSIRWTLDLLILTIVTFVTNRRHGLWFCGERFGNLQ